MSDNSGENYPGDGMSLPPFPNPSPDWSQDDPSHPGFVVIGLNDTPGQKAYYIHMEAKPGKEELLLAFLQDIHDGIDKEPLTGPWFALRYPKTTFGIFEAFPDSQARHDHDNGPGGQNFFTRPELLHDLLAYPAQLHRLDILHGKFGSSWANQSRLPDKGYPWACCTANALKPRLQALTFDTTGANLKRPGDEPEKFTSLMPA